MRARWLRRKSNEPARPTEPGWFSTAFGGATGSIAITFVAVLLVGLFWVGTGVLHHRQPHHYRHRRCGTAPGRDVLGLRAAGRGGGPRASVPAPACAPPIFAYLTVHHWGAWEAAGIVVLIGVLVGATNAVVIVGFGANALAATLGMLTVLLGLQYVICGGDGSDHEPGPGAVQLCQPSARTGTPRLRIDPLACRGCLLRGRLLPASGGTSGLSGGTKWPAGGPASTSNGSGSESLC